MRNRSPTASINRLALVLLLAHFGTAGNLAQNPENIPLVAKATVEVHLETENKIPHILHHIYLSGYDAYIAEAERQHSKIHLWHRETCLEVHKHWKIMFWTEQMAVDLITTHYRWFLPVWNSYDMEVKKADALRPFILWHYGGLYLDLDNECYRPAESLFKDYDVVLQATGYEGVNNGMMASRPGHPLFKMLIQELIRRHRRTEVPTEFFKNLPIYMTGPDVLTFTLEEYFSFPFPVPTWLSRTYKVEKSIIRVYTLGEFFVPCWGVDIICLKRFEKGRARNVLDMSMLAGRHWFAGSWNKPELLHLPANSTY